MSEYIVVKMYTGIIHHAEKIYSAVDREDAEYMVKTIKERNPTWTLAILVEETDGN